MHLMKSKELNERIIKECNVKVERSLESKGFDPECFEVLSQAIDNLKDISKIEAYENEENKVFPVKKKMGI